jgi:hypothetical protein
MGRSGSPGTCKNVTSHCIWRIHNVPLAHCKLFQREVRTEPSPTGVAMIAVLRAIEPMFAWTQVCQLHCPHICSKSGFASHRSLTGSCPKRGRICYFIASIRNVSLKMNNSGFVFDFITLTTFGEMQCWYQGHNAPGKIRWIEKRNITSSGIEPPTIKRL